MTTEKEIECLKAGLKRLRLLRDQQPIGSEIRTHYNTTCDQLDVLISKIDQKHRLSIETKIRT